MHISRIGQEAIASRLYQILLYLLLPFFGVCIYLSYGTKYLESLDRLFSALIIVLGSLLYLLFMVFINMIIEKCSDRALKYLTIGLFCLLISGFLFVAIRIQPVPLVDLLHVHAESVQMLETGRVTSEYFQVYPNNEALAILLYGVFKLSSVFGASNFRLVGALFNVVMCTATAIFVYKIARLLYGRKRATLVMAVYTTTPVLYFFVPYYYTDTVHLPFAMGGIYLFMVAMKKYGFKRYSRLFISAAILCMGYEIRATAIMLFVGLLIYMCMTCKPKQLLAGVAACLVGFTLASAGYGELVDTYGIPPDKSIEFPYTHWIMLGISSPHGGYRQGDFDLTKSIAGYEEKKEFNQEEIKRRLAERGIKGTIAFQLKKIKLTWTTGTNRYSHYQQISNNYDGLYNLISGNQSFVMHYICQFMRAALFILLGISAVRSIHRRKVCLEAPLYIALFGGILFYMLWETHERFSFSFLPIMIILAGSSVAQLHHVKKLSKPLTKAATRFERLKGQIQLYRIAQSGMAILLTLIFFVGIKGIQPATVDMHEKAWKRVNQELSKPRDGGGIPAVTDHDAIQTFQVGEPFNQILLRFINKGSEKALYEFSLTDEAGKIFAQETFLSETAIDGEIRRFYFETISPAEKQTYSIRIRLLDDNGDTPLGMWGYYDETVYPEGKLSYDEKTRGNLSFTVRYIADGPYVSRSIYFLIWITGMALPTAAMVLLCRSKRRCIRRKN